MLWQNHDVTKIIVENSGLLGIVMLFIFLILFAISVKKSDKDQGILSRGFTDQLKGIAILMVILHHVTVHTLKDPLQLSFFYDLGYIAVGIFLLLSGYGLNESFKQKGISGFWKSKLTKIYLTFVFFNILWLGLDLITTGNKLGLTDIVTRSAGFVIVSRDYWYIRFLFLWYAAFFLLKKLNLPRKNELTMLIVISTAIVFNEQFQIGRFNAYSFALGVGISLYQDRIISGVKYIESRVSKSMGKLWLLLIPLVGLWLTSTVYFKGIDYQRNGYSQLTALVALFILPILAYLIIRSRLKKELYVGFIFSVLLGISIFWQSNILPIILITASCILGVISIILLFKLLLADYSSSVYELIGRLSLEIYLLHGALLYNYDLILYRGPLEITIPIYIFVVIVCAWIIQKILGKLSYYLEKLLGL